MGQIKCIIQVADIHIRNYQRQDEYGEQLERFIDRCRDITSQYERDEVRIVIVGDLVHSKVSVSNELMIFTSMFIRELEKIAKVILVSGNHDLMVNNQSRTDTITALVNTAQFENTVFLDEALEYKSGCVIDNNIVWALYSIFDDYSRPSIEEVERDGKKVIGLFHGDLVGASYNNGIVSDIGISADEFIGCDCVMCGHIHKRQTIRKNGIDIVYCGSLIQQTFGETVTQHGFTIWNVEDLSYEHVDLDSDYSLFDIEISSEKDIDDDVEILKNL